MEKMDLFFEKITKNIDSKKIVFWGAGGLSRQLISLFNLPFKISCFVDNNADLWDEKVLEIPVKNPKDLFRQEKSKVFIFIATSYSTDVIKQLEEQGFKCDENYSTILVDIYRLVFELLNDNNDTNFAEAKIKFATAVSKRLEIDPEFLVPAPELPAEKISLAKILPSRIKMLDCLPKNAVCAEIGTLYGDFAREIISRTNPEKLHIVEMEWKNFKSMGMEKDIEQGRILMHNGCSWEVLDTFPDNYFDWIYIDANHTYFAVKKDIKVAIRKIKQDGYLIFNDYTLWDPLGVTEYGVMRAVNELVNTSDFSVKYLALECRGFNDIVLQRN